MEIPITTLFERFLLLFHKKRYCIDTGDKLHKGCKVTFKIMNNKVYIIKEEKI